MGSAKKNLLKGNFSFRLLPQNVGLLYVGSFDRPFAQIKVRAMNFVCLDETFVGIIAWFVGINSYVTNRGSLHFLRGIVPLLSWNMPDLFSWINKTVPYRDISL